MNKLYLITGEISGDDLNLDLIVVASNPADALNIWQTYYKGTLYDFDFCWQNVVLQDEKDQVDLLGEEDIRIYQMHFDINNIGAINWNDSSGMQLVAGVIC